MKKYFIFIALLLCAFLASPVFGEFESGKVDDTAYNATTWDGVTSVAPSKNAVRDKIEALTPALVTVVDSTDTTTWPLIVDDQTGSTAPKTDGALTYNATTGLLSTTLLKMTSGAGTNYILTSDADGDASWSSSLSVTTLDLTSATSSIPFPVGTATVDAGMTAAGKIYFESDTEILSIGDGATIINLDMAPNVTYTFPTTSQTLATLAGSETLTNKTITTPIISSLEVLIDCNGSADPYAYCTSANASTLTATHTSRTIINSYGRGEAQTVTLPAAATGMTFIALVGTQHNSAWKIQRAGSDTITWSSGGTDTTGKTYFQETNQAVGSRVSCITYKSGAAAWSWLCGSVTGTWVTD